MKVKSTKYVRNRVSGPPRDRVQLQRDQRVFPDYHEKSDKSTDTLRESCSCEAGCRDSKTHQRDGNASSLPIPHYNSFSRNPWTVPTGENSGQWSKLLVRFQSPRRFKVLVSTQRL